MNSELIIEVINKLIGSIEPYGSESIDKERLKNLESLIDVMDEYVDKIIKVAKYRSRCEYSIVMIADRAYEWLDGLCEYVDEELPAIRRKNEID